MKFKPSLQISVSPSNKHSLAPPWPSHLKSIKLPLLGLFPDPQKLNYFSAYNTYYMYTWSQTCSLTHNTSIARIEKQSSTQIMTSFSLHHGQFHHHNYRIWCTVIHTYESNLHVGRVLSLATTSHKQPKKNHQNFPNWIAIVGISSEWSPLISNHNHGFGCRMILKFPNVFIPQ